MQEKLEGLIERIEREAVTEAENKAGEIRRQAQEEADSKVAAAQTEAEQIIEEARRQTARFQENAELALKQTARDMELLLKDRITALFDRVFKRQAATVLTPDFLKDLIVRVTAEWAGGSGVEIALNEADQQKLQDLLVEGLRADLKEGLTIKVDNAIATGFRIGLREEDVYYDFTDDAVADALKLLSGPGVREILDKQEQDG